MLIYLYAGLGRNGLLNFVPDSVYVKTIHKLITGEKINLNNPETFNEKIEYLKVHDHNQKYTDCVDKYKSKMLVKEILGEQYVVPLYG